MGLRKRRYYTETEKALMWDRWQQGDSMNEIGRALGIQGHSSIQTIFSATGGDSPEVHADSDGRKQGSPERGSKE